MFQAKRNSALRRLISVVLLLATAQASALVSSAAVQSSKRWEAKLDGTVRFYQATPFGLILAGTDKSLYALDGEAGTTLWRRRQQKKTPLDAEDVAVVPGTDLALLNLEDDERARLEAVDVFSGETIWRSEKVRGQIMHMAADVDADLVAVITARDAKRRPTGERLKRRPTARVLRISTGEELWKRDARGEVEMMPERWDDAKEGWSHTLDNYRPPLFLDDKLYLFYEGVASYDAASGREREQVRFRVNEENLALTESDPAFDETNIYLSGRGRVRAVARGGGDDGGEVKWEASDLGLTPEMLLSGNGGTLYVRTGGQFTRLEDGETEKRGPYGVSAIDARTGKILWRYKGADQGITNLALPRDAQTLLIADRDDLLVIDARTGRRLRKITHRLEQAAFVVINDRDQAVVGGRNEIAAFDPGSGEQLWRARRTPPGRGALRIIGAISARAVALYFNYGGAATTALRGAQIARSVGALRWTNVAARALPNLTSLAANYTRETALSRFRAYGVAASRLGSGGGSPNLTRPRLAVGAPQVDVRGRALDLVDPAKQLERLSRFLLRRERLATLRGEWMYFYTELPTGGDGLAGVNVNRESADRNIRLEQLDARFTVDESVGLLYTARGDRLTAIGVN